MQICEDAKVAVDRLAAAPVEPGFVVHSIWLLRARALLARARGDDAAYHGLPGRLPKDGDRARF